MSTRPAQKLYTPELLALATGLADYPLAGPFAAQAEARSRSCGSVVAIGFNLDDSGQIAGLGMKVSACAIGQASAAVLAGGVIGTDPEEVHRAARKISDWLAGEGELPTWPGIAALAPALAHPGRHGALLLPWKAASEALPHHAP